MAHTSEPEIRRCNLTSSVLHFKCLGQDMEELDFMDKPELNAGASTLRHRWFAEPTDFSVSAALMTLYLLQAIDNKKMVTDLGRAMAGFPLEPPLARSVLASQEYGCTLEILDIIAVLSSSSKLFLDVSEEREFALQSRGKFQHSSGDHMTILNVLRSYEEIARVESRAWRKEWCRKQFFNERTLLEATRIRDQLRLTCDRMGLDWRLSCKSDEEPVLRSLVLGFVQNSALLQPDGSYRQLMGRSVSSDQLIHLQFQERSSGDQDPSQFDS
jgi:HrpA-like RNA helicase